MKALLEPWQQECEAEQTKWNPDRLKPWVEPKRKFVEKSFAIPSLSASCLAVHVACQFNLHQLPKPSKMEKSNLNAVRDIIKILFQNFVSEKPPGISLVHILLDAWQKNHLPLEENSPWLATFISPLYRDAPLDKKKVKPNLFLRYFNLFYFLLTLNFYSFHLFGFAFSNF